MKGYILEREEELTLLTELGIEGILKALHEEESLFDVARNNLVEACFPVLA